MRKREVRTAVRLCDGGEVRIVVSTTEREA